MAQLSSLYPFDVHHHRFHIISRAMDSNERPLMSLLKQSRSRPDLPPFNARGNVTEASHPIFVASDPALTANHLRPSVEGEAKLTTMGEVRLEDRGKHTSHRNVTGLAALLEGGRPLHPVDLPVTVIHLAGSQKACDISSVFCHPLRALTVCHCGSFFHHALTHPIIDFTLISYLRRHRSLSRYPHCPSSLGRDQCADGNRSWWWREWWRTR